MDATGPGSLLAELNALALRSDRDLYARLASLDRAALAGLMAHVPRDCTCRAVCPDHPDDPCDCVCPHVEAARRRTWPLCVEAVAYLLWISDPKRYADPRPPVGPSCNTNPETQVSVMAERHRRGEHLYHPGDWVRLGMDAIDARLGRGTRRLRNGADVAGDLMLEASHAD